MALGSFTSFSLGFHDSAVLHCTKMWDSGVDLLFSVLIIPIPCWISRWHCRLRSRRSISERGRENYGPLTQSLFWKTSGPGMRQLICLLPRCLLRNLNDLCAKDDEKNKTSPLFYLAFFIFALVPRVSSPVTRVCCSPLFAPKRAKDKAPDDDDEEEEEEADFAQLRAIIQQKQTLI